MELEYHLQAQDGFFEGRLEGRLSLAAVEIAGRAITQAATSRRFARTLWACTGVHGHWTRAHRIALGIFLAEQQRLSAPALAEAPRLAIWVSPGLMDPERPTESAANSRGGRVRASADLEELMHWLKAR